MSGADFLIGNSGPKKHREVKLAPNGIAVTSDEVEAVLSSFSGDGKRLGATMKQAVQQLDTIKAVGLTGEALVVLTQAKCAARRTAGGRYLTPDLDTVRCVLEGLFKLGEWVR